MRLRSALLVPALVLAGCSGTALGDLASMAGVGGSAGNGPEGAVSPPALSGSTSECYQGTWLLQPETAWSDENLERMGLGRGTDMEYVGSQGDAWLTLQPNGTYQWTLNRFAVTLRGNTDSSSPTDVTVHLHGMMYGSATESGANELAMAYGRPSQREAQITSYAEVAGSGMGSLGRINLDVERLMGPSSWTTTLRCGSGTLSLTTENDASGALQNATYTRAR